MELENYAKLSGIEIPEDLLKAVSEAQARISNLHEKSAELKNEASALENKIADSAAKEATALVNNADPGKLASMRKRLEGRAREIEILILNLQKLEPSVRNDLAAAKEKLSAYINEQLIKGRAEMERQLELAIQERGRSLGSLRHGDKLRSTPPMQNSKSKVAVCEICRRDIGLFDPNEIRQPVHASHFRRLPPRFEHAPFNPRAGIEDFFCPIYNKKPWGDFDRILTNHGYFVLKEDDQNSEQAK